MQKPGSKSKSWLEYLFPTLVILCVFLAVWVQLRVISQYQWKFLDFYHYRLGGLRALASETIYIPGSLEFIYSPPALLLILPFAWLNYENACIIWTAINLIGVIGAFAIFVRVFKMRHLDNFVVFTIVLFFSFAPLYDSLAYGQVNGIILFCLSGFVVGFFSKKYAWAGDTAFGLAVLLKLTPALLLAVLVVQKDWKRLVRFGLILAGYILLSVVLFGISPWRDYVLKVIPAILGGGAEPTTLNLNLAITLQYFVSRSNPNILVYKEITILLSILFLAVWLGILWLRWQAAQWMELVNFGLASMLLCSPIIEYHHLLVFLIPFLFIAAQTRHSSSEHLFYGFCLGFLLIQVDRLVEVMYYLPAIPAQLGCLLVYGLCLGRALRSPRKQDSGCLAGGSSKTPTINML